MADYTSTEIMTIEASRRLANGTVCFVGIGMPSAAANLARLTHAPEVVLIYESGTIGTRHPPRYSVGISADAVMRWTYSERYISANFIEPNSVL